MQSGAAILNEAVRLVIFGLKRRRVDGRVEGFSLPPLDHGSHRPRDRRFSLSGHILRSEACRRRLDQDTIA